MHRKPFVFSAQLRITTWFTLVVLMSFILLLILSSPSPILSGQESWKQQRFKRVAVACWDLTVAMLLSEGWGGDHKNRDDDTAISMIIAKMGPVIGISKKHWKPQRGHSAVYQCWERLHPYTCLPLNTPGSTFWSQSKVSSQRSDIWKGGFWCSFLPVAPLSGDGATCKMALLLQRFFNEQTDLHRYK